MPPDNITIIPMQMEYVRSFHALLDSVCKERNFLVLLQAPPLKQIKQFVGDILRRGDVQMVALSQQRIVGWCDIVSQELPGFEHTGRLGMGVARDYRGQGIGLRLARAAIDAAFAKAFRRIELEVYASNEPAIRLYEKLGFALEGRKIRARFLDGQYEDVLLMALLPKGRV